MEYIILVIVSLLSVWHIVNAKLMIEILWGENLLWAFLMCEGTLILIGVIVPISLWAEKNKK